MNKLSIRILNGEECFTFNERLLNVLKTDLAEEVVVKEMIPYLIEVNAGLSAILRKLRHSRITEQLVEKDKARNAAFVSLRDYCQAVYSRARSATGGSC